MKTPDAHNNFLNYVALVRVPVRARVRVLIREMAIFENYKITVRHNK